MSNTETIEQFAQAANELGILKPVGSQSFSVITRLNPTEEHSEYVGNILRRTCTKLGEVSCQAACAFRSQPEYPADDERACADLNLATALSKLHIEPSEAIMVAVTGDEVGFGDQVAGYREAGKLKDNPEGWMELPGFNAFFARAGEIPAIGSRLADCAHVEFEFKDANGETVIGFEHGTRPNMFGASAYKFMVDGEPTSYTHFVLNSAMRHYGADPSFFHIRLGSSIKPDNFVKHFDNAEAMERHIPGWQQAGFVRNASNPNWQPGDPIDAEDEWHADARGLILHDIAEAMAKSGIASEQFAADDMLDPADKHGEFSSYENRNIFGDMRDLYLIAHQRAFQGVK